MNRLTYEHPEARHAVEPVTVEGDAAVAGWTEGEMGGRVLPTAIAA